MLVFAIIDITVAGGGAFIYLYMEIILTACGIIMTDVDYGKWKYSTVVPHWLATSLTRLVPNLRHFLRTTKGQYYLLYWQPIEAYT